MSPVKQIDGAVLIVGVGAGLGASLAHRFAAEGLPVAVAARSSESLDRIVNDIGKQGGRVLAVPHDATDPAQVAEAVRNVREHFGSIGTLIYNAGNFVRGPVTDVAPEAFEAALRIGPYGAYLYARELAPEMIKQGQGTMIFTGATSSVMAPAHGPAFAASKFGLRGLAMSLARDLGTHGIHVAHVILDSVIDTPTLRESNVEWDTSELLDPDAIAQAYWFLASQPARATTFELDLRTLLDDYLDN